VQVTNRIEWIDSLKGLGIIAIYLGHFANDAGALYSFVFTYHVPLFFFISGFFGRAKPGDSFLQFVKRKFFRLMVPYFGFVFIAIFVYLLSMDVDVKTMLVQGFFGVRNNLFAGSLWFLPCLFVMSIMYQSVLIILKKKRFALIIAIALFIVTQTLFTQSPSSKPCWFWNIDSAMYYMIFYATGSMVFPYLRDFRIKTLSVSKRVCIFLFGAFSVLITAIVYFKGSGTIYALIGVDFFLIQWLYKICLPLLMISSNIMVAILLRKVSVLKLLGKSTLALCGTEQIIKIIIPTVLGLFSLSLKLFTPLATVLYTLICLLVNRFTIVAVIENNLPVLNGKSKWCE